MVVCDMERCERGGKGVEEVGSRLRLPGRCSIASAILAASALLDGFRFRYWLGLGFCFASAVLAATRLRDWLGLGDRLRLSFACTVFATPRLGDWFRLLQ